MRDHLITAGAIVEMLRSHNAAGPLCRDLAEHSLCELASLLRRIEAGELAEGATVRLPVTTLASITAQAIRARKARMELVKGGDE